MEENRVLTFDQTSSWSERKLINGVFTWMALGLFVTAGLAYTVAKTPAILALLIHEDGLTVTGYAVMFAPLVFVLLMSFGFTSFSSTTLMILYLIYACMIGASLAFIFLIYSDESIYATFMTAGSMFGIMAIIGYFTAIDLTRMGNIFLMALIGIIIASTVNVFMRSNSFSLIISFISIALFCGLTAWDVQKMKKLNEQHADGKLLYKLQVMGALTLYLDFINIFLSLLRFMGKRRK